jgi:hypothetical protein
LITRKQARGLDRCLGAILDRRSAREGWQVLVGGGAGADAPSRAREETRNQREPQSEHFGAEDEGVLRKKPDQAPFGYPGARAPAIRRAFNDDVALPRDAVEG